MKANFKFAVSSLVGVAVALGTSIFNHQLQPNGVGEDLVVQFAVVAWWFFEKVPTFLIAFISCFSAMLIWQKAHKKSFLSARAKFFGFFDHMLDD